MPLDQTLGATDPTYDPQSIVTGLIGQQEPDLVQGGTVDPQAVLNRLIRKGLARQSAPSSQAADFSAFGKTPQELGPNAAPNGETPDFASYGEPADAGSQPNPQYTGGGNGTAESPYTGSVPTERPEESGPVAGAEAAVAAPVQMAGGVLKGAAVQANPRSAFGIAEGLSLAPINPAGAVGAAAGAIKNLVGVPQEPVEQNPVYQAGQAIEDVGKDIGPSEASKKAHPIWTGIGAGLGATGSALALAAADPAAGIAGGAALFGLSSEGDTYDEAKKQGATDETAYAAAQLSGMANAALGALPIANVLKPFEKVMPQAAGLGVKILAQAAQNGVVFTTVGEAQEFIGQQIAKLYDPKAGYSPDAERLISEFAAAAVLGGLHAGLAGRGETAETAAQPGQTGENRQNPPGTKGLPPADEAGAGTGGGPQPQPGTGGAGAGTRSNMRGPSPGDTVYSDPDAPQYWKENGEFDGDQFWRDQASAQAAGKKGWTYTGRQESGDQQQNGPGAQQAGPQAQPEPPPPPFETQLNPRIRSVLEEKARYYGEFSPEIIASWSDDKLKDYVNTKFGFGSKRESDDEILRRYGFSAEDVSAMSDEQKSAAVDEALKHGVHAGQAPQGAQGTADNPVDLNSAEDVATAAGMASQDHSHAQGEAGNAQRGHATWNGLDLSIEVPPGGTRKGTVPGTGEPWETQHPHAYGEILGVPNAADGMRPDVIVGDHPDAPYAYVIDELDKRTGKYKQSKSFVGFQSPEEARASYLGITSKSPEQIAAIEAFPSAEFPDLVRKGLLSGPVAGKGSGGDRNNVSAEAEPAEQAPPTHADHEAIEAALRQVGVDPKHIRPVDLQRAAEIHAQEGYSPEESFQLAVARAGVEDGLLTPEQVEQNYGPEIAAAILPAREPLERGVSVPAHNASTLGQATPREDQRLPGGGAHGEKDRGNEAAENATPPESVRTEEPAGNAGGRGGNTGAAAGHPEAGTADLQRGAGREHTAAGERQPSGGKTAARGEAAANAEDAGHLTVPESEATLRLQQRALIDGRRPVQMFPKGSKELPLPKGMQRVEAPSGDIFHFNPKKTSEKAILKASASGNENRILGLGPYNKAEIAARIARGEKPVAVTERTPNGTEVRAAAGTEQTAPTQVAVIERNKTPGNLIQIEHPMQPIEERRKAQSVGGQPFAGMIENEEKYRQNAKKRRENGLGTNKVYKSEEAEWRRHGLTGAEAKAQYEAATAENTKKFDAAMKQAAIPRNAIPDDVYHAAVDYMHSLAFDPLEALDYAMLKAEHEAQFLESQEAYEAAQHIFDREEGPNADVASIPPETERASARLGDEDEARREATTGGEVGVSQRPAGAGTGPATVTGRGSEPATGHEPTGTESTAAGEQHVIPGTERISDAERAKRHAEQPLKPKVAQKPADEGLFSDESKQTDLVDRARAAKPPPETEAPANVETEEKAPETGPSDSGARQQKPKRSRKPRPSIGFAESRGEIAPPFYSAVARAVEGAKQEKASPNEWLGMLKNAPGVRPEEMQWLGLDQWLRAHKGPITKTELAEYVHAHQIEVREIEKGRVAPELKLAREINERLIRKYGSLGEAFERWTPEEQEEFDRIHAAAAAVDEEPEDTKFQQYTLPGGENYRELLLTLPVERNNPADVRFDDAKGGYIAIDRSGKDLTPGAWESPQQAMEAARSIPSSVGAGRTFQSSHWDEPNVLAHVRFDDRIGPKGEKILHVAEIQSDWHQAGRKKGYVTPVPPELTAAAQEIVDRKILPNVKFLLPGMVRNGHIDLDHLAQRDIDHWAKQRALSEGERSTITQWIDARSSEVGTLRVPDAPFKTTWPELSLKRIIRYAAENGYDRLTWDTGDTNAERYDLSRALDRIEYSKEPDGRWHISPYATDDPTAILAEGDIPRKFSSAEEIERVYGKEVAEKIAKGAGAAPPRITRFNRDTKVLRGNDLKVGGEGMCVFYDKILPAAANKLAKKFGTRVEQAQLDTYGEEPFTTVETDDGRFEVVDRRTAERVPDLPRYSTMEQADHAADQRNYAAYTEGETDAAATVHSLYITKALRDAAVRQGFALFQPSRGPFSGRQHGIPPEARQPIFSYRSADDLKRHPDYVAAKAGDAAAAVRLVRDLVTPKQIEAAKARFGSDVTYVPVIAEERTGDNAIPAALAGRYAVETGASWTNEVTQENHAYHTGAGAMERLANRATFEGNVEAGKRYVLVDDVSVMGSTLADLADHIQRSGGKVAGAVLLAHAGRSPILTPAESAIRDIQRRHGDAIRDLFGIDPASLTADEAAYLRNFRNADELKARKAAAERERSVRLGAKGLLQERVGEPTAGTTQGAQSGAPFISETLKQAKLGGSFRPIPGARLGAEAQNYVLARGRATGNEHVVAIHRNGGIALQAEGGESGIRFAPSEAGLFADPANDLVVHHNHPNNGAFSIQDLSMLGSPGMHSLWAHGHEGNISRIGPTPLGRQIFQAADFERNIERMARFVRAVGESQFTKPLIALVRDRAIRPQRADTLYLHLIAESLRRAGLVDYHTSGGFENEIAELGLGPYIDRAARAIIKSTLNGYTDQNPTPGHDRRTGTVFEHPGDLGAAFERDRIASAGYTRSPNPNRLRQTNDRAQPQGPVGLAEDNSGPFGNGPQTAAGGAGGQQPPPPPGQTTTAPQPPGNPWRSITSRVSDAIGGETGKKLIEGFSDYSHRVRLLQNDVDALYHHWVDAEGKPPDEQQFYTLKRLFPGKRAARTDVFNKEHFEPLAKFLRDNKIAEKEAGDYLYAKHAPERNQAMGALYAQTRLGNPPQEHQFSRARRDPNVAGGSGMSLNQARGITTQAERGPKAAAFAELLRRVAAVRNFIQEEALRGGLVNRETLAEWNRTYQHYVPLKEWDDPAEAPDNVTPSGGRGRGDIRGPENKMAFGRRTKADNPLAHLLTQAYRTIDRAERNRVFNSMANALANLKRAGAPIEDALGIHLNKGRPQKQIDKDTGLARVVDSQMDRFGDNAVQFKRNGEPRYFVFDDRATADAARRWSPAALPGPLHALLWLMNKMKSLWTHYSPNFLVRHNARYYVESVLNAMELKETGEHSAATHARQAFPVIGAATRAIFAVERGETPDQHTGEMADLMRSYVLQKEHGGVMAMRTMRDIDQVKEDIRVHMNDLARGAANVIRVWHGAVETMNRISSVWDNGQRLATAHSAMKQGRSPQEAALLGRDATIDYQYRGLWSNIMGLWEPFFNTALRTGFRLGGAMSRSKIMRGVFLGTLAMGLATSAWNYFVGGNDKDGVPFFDKIPPYERSKSLILLAPWIPDAKGRPSAVKFPFPYNWGGALSMGYGLGNFLWGSEPLTTVLKEAFLKPFVSMFSEVGEEGIGVRSIVPELIRPEYDIATNRDWAGRPIHIDEAFQKAPNAYSGKKDYGGRVRTGEGWKDIAETLNDYSGGSRRQSGIFDFYPEDIREVLNPFVGTQVGFGNEAYQTGKSIAAGQPINPTTVPIGRVFFGQDYDAANRFAQFQHSQKAKHPWMRIDQPRVTKPTRTLP